MVVRQPCEGAGTSEFHRRDGALWCDDVSVAELAARYGTPLYVYSAAAVRRRIAAVRDAFGADAHVCYAVKANSNLSLLRLVHEAGCGFDLVSGGELERLAAAGLPAHSAVFAGVAKQSWEIDAAVAAGILFFNVESPHELPSLSAAGQRAGRPVRVALRLNPDVDAGTHAYISTGRQENKFGVAIARAAEVVASIVADPWLELVGYHVHLGSQLHQVAPYATALQRVCEFVDGDPMRSRGVRYYDLGGGFGIGYGKGPELDVAAVAAALLPTLQQRGWLPVVEPGRYLAGDAGILVTAVLGEKAQGAADFLLVDAAMNDLLRPALYQAEHAIVPVASALPPAAAAALATAALGGAVAAPDRSLRKVDIVGPVCETGDFLARGRMLPPCRTGDLLAVLAAGAYGASMASNYNTRRRPAEVLVDGSTVRLVRRRESFAGMFADELPSDAADVATDRAGSDLRSGSGDERA